MKWFDVVSNIENHGQICKSDAGEFTSSGLEKNFYFPEKDMKKIRKLRKGEEHIYTDLCGDYWIVNRVE